MYARNRYLKLGFAKGQLACVNVTGDYKPIECVKHTKWSVYMACLCSVLFVHSNRA